MPATITEAAITCPECEVTHVETMPTDACKFFYTCASLAAQAAAW